MLLASLFAVQGCFLEDELVFLGVRVGRLCHEHVLVGHFKSYFSFNITFVEAEIHFQAHCYDIYHRINIPILIKEQKGNVRFILKLSLSSNEFLK